MARMYRLIFFHVPFTASLVSSSSCHYHHNRQKACHIKPCIVQCQIAYRLVLLSEQIQDLDRIPHLLSLITLTS